VQYRGSDSCVFTNIDYQRKLFSKEKTTASRIQFNHKSKVPDPRKRAEGKEPYVSTKSRIVVSTDFIESWKI
jgi:hypothetical protein